MWRSLPRSRSPQSRHEAASSRASVPALLLGRVLVVLVATGNAGPSATTAPSAPRAAKPRAGRPLRLRGAPGAAARCRSSWARARPARARSRQLAARLRGCCRDGRFQAVPGGLRNVVGTVPGPRAGLRGRRRPLRHEGHARLRGRERRRVAARPWPFSWRARSSRARCGERSSSSCSTARRARAACPTRSSRAKGLRGAKVAARRVPGRAGDGAARLRRRPAAQHAARGLLGRAACGRACARRRARAGVGALLPGRRRAARSSTTTSRSSSRACPRST